MARTWAKKGKTCSESRNTSNVNKPNAKIVATCNLQIQNCDFANAKAKGTRTATFSEMKRTSSRIASRSETSANPSVVKSAKRKAEERNGVVGGNGDATAAASKKAWTCKEKEQLIAGEGILWNFLSTLTGLSKLEPITAAMCPNKIRKICLDCTKIFPGVHLEPKSVPYKLSLIRLILCVSPGLRHEVNPRWGRNFYDHPGKLFIFSLRIEESWIG